MPDWLPDWNSPSDTIVPILTTQLWCLIVNAFQQFPWNNSTNTVIHKLLYPMWCNILLMALKYQILKISGQIISVVMQFSKEFNRIEARSPLLPAMVGTNIMIHIHTAWSAFLLWLYHQWLATHSVCVVWYWQTIWYWRTWVKRTGIGPQLKQSPNVHNIFKASKVSYELLRLMVN